MNFGYTLWTMNSYGKDTSIIPSLKGELQKLSILFLIVKIRNANLTICQKENIPIKNYRIYLPKYLIGILFLLPETVWDELNLDGLFETYDVKSIDELFDKIKDLKLFSGINLQECL